MQIQISAVSKQRLRRCAPGRTSSRPNRGMSLIECLVAVAVLAMVGIGVISSVTMTRQLAEFSKQRQSAIAVARDYLEQRARRDLYPTLTPISDVIIDNFNTPDGSDDLRAAMEVRIYEVRIDGSRGAELLAAPSTDDRLEVEITISWNRTGRLSSRRVSETLRTYVAPDM